MAEMRVTHRADAIISYVRNSSNGSLHGDTKRVTTNWVGDMPMVDMSTPVSFIHKNGVLNVEIEGRHYIMRAKRKEFTNELRGFLALDDRLIEGYRVKEER